MDLRSGKTKGIPKASLGTMLPSSDNQPEGVGKMNSAAAEPRPSRLSPRKISQPIEEPGMLDKLSLTEIKLDHKYVLDEKSERSSSNLDPDGDIQHPRSSAHWHSLRKITCVFALFITTALLIVWLHNFLAPPPTATPLTTGTTPGCAWIVSVKRSETGLSAEEYCGLDIWKMDSKIPQNECVCDERERKTNF